MALIRHLIIEHLSIFMNQHDFQVALAMTWGSEDLPEPLSTIENPTHCDFLEPPMNWTAELNNLTSCCQMNQLSFPSDLFAKLS